MTCIQYNQYSQRFHVITTIGKGNYASVLKITDAKNKKEYALKCTKLNSVEELSVALQEIEVIRAINHPLAIQILYYFTKIPNAQKFLSCQIEFGVIMELGDRSLSQDILIRKKKNKYYSQYEIQDLSQTLINFFAHMQKKGYMHRDIKPQNILILTTPGAKLPAIDTYRVCDFGFAIKNHDFADRNIAGTASYASPKIKNKFDHAEIFVKGNNYRDDTFSLGVTLIEACTLQTVGEKIPKKLLSEVSSRYGDKIAFLLESMVEFEENKRFDFLELSKHFEQKIKFQKIESQIIFGNTSNVPVYLPNPLNNKSKQKVKFYHAEDVESTATDSFCFINMGKDCQIQQSPANQKQSLFKTDENFRNTEKKRQSSPKQSIIQRNEEALNQITSIKAFGRGKSKEKYSFPLNYTPKIDQTQKFSQNPENIFAPSLSPSKGNDDKVKTKRKSKFLVNSNTSFPANFKGMNYKQIMKETKNNLNSFKQMNQNGGNREEVMPYLPKILKVEAKVLFKFEKSSEIQMLTVANILDEEKDENKLIVIAISNGHLFICSHCFGQENLIIEVQFNRLLDNPKFLIFCSKIGRLIIVCENQIIHTLSANNLASCLNEVIKKKSSSVTSAQLGFLELKTKTSGMMAMSVSQTTGDILKGFKNGEIYENNKLVTSGVKNNQMTFVIKWGRFMFVGSQKGAISKHYYKESDNGSTHLIGYLNCKCTVIGMELAYLGSRTVLIVLLCNGFILQINQNLDVISSKQISKACISSGKIDFSLDQGRRVMAINSLGHVVNERGQILAETGVTDCQEVYLLDSSDKIILVTQSKSIYEAKLKINTFENQKPQMVTYEHSHSELRMQESLKFWDTNKKSEKESYSKLLEPTIGQKYNVLFDF